MRQHRRLYLILLFLVVFVGVNKVPSSANDLSGYIRGQRIKSGARIIDGGSCIVDFRKGILTVGTHKVILGETRFKEIKKLFGNVKETNRRYFFSTADGFFALRSELYYPQIGLRFQYSSTIHQRGQRSFFQNHKVNSIHFEKNSDCRTSEGVGFGSTYAEIISILKPDFISYSHVYGKGYSGVKARSEVYCDVYLSSDLQVTIWFKGDKALDKSDFIVNDEIVFYIWPRR